MRLLTEKDVRRATSDAHDNRSASGLVVFEILLISAIVGFGGTSWISGVVVFFVLLLLMAIPYVRIVTYIAISVAWASLLLFTLVQQSEVTEPSGGQMFAAFAVFVLSFAAHLGFRNHLNDQQKNRTKEGQHQESSIPPGERECPVCAEIIKAKAIKCRHCQSTIDPAAV